MQAVRCGACGKKALVAASQCPHCGHLLDLRDGYGNLLPLAHCPTCECDYPVSDGACRWCGTRPETVRLTPYMWKGAGIVAFAGMAIGVWMTRDDGGNVGPRPSAAPVEVQLASLEPPAAELVSVPVAPPAPAPISAAAPLTAPPSEAKQVGPPAPALAVERRPPRGVGPLSGAPVPVRAGRTERAGRWTRAVALSWATVRAGPHASTRLVGSVGPDTRLELGEAREGWRRVRLRGMSGWINERLVTLRQAPSARRAPR